MKDRRQGLYSFYSRDGIYNFVEAITAPSKVEKFQQLAEPEAVKYAIGAMQAVDAEYTKKSYEEGNRVRDRLGEGLSTAGIPALFDYQGSVPLDVHVRGNSDIDLLVLHDGFVTVEAAVQAAYSYSDRPGKTLSEELADLRKECVAILAPLLGRQDRLDTEQSDYADRRLAPACGRRHPFPLARHNRLEEDRRQAVPRHLRLRQQSGSAHEEPALHAHRSYRGQVHQCARGAFASASV